MRSMALWRAVWMIQARGNSGTPETRHWSTAAVKASWAASSATSKSRTSRTGWRRSGPSRSDTPRRRPRLRPRAYFTLDNFPSGVDSGPLPFDLQLEGPVKYMLLICRDEPAWDKLGVTERQQVYAETLKLSEELTARGQYLGGFPLHPSSAATSVRVRDGKRLVTDGPFAETREQLGGYMIVDVKDLDEAIAIAARIPLARTSTVEVRPVREGQPS